MMKKVLGFVWILFATTGITFGQDELSQLLRERDELYKSYEYYNAQNNSLFGKKSKKDLQNIIETLQGIINKDSEIVNMVRNQSARMRMENNRKESSYIGQTRETMNLINNLNEEVDKLNAMVKLKNSELATQRENYHALEEKITFLSIVLGVMVLAVVLLVVYIRRLKTLVHEKSQSI